MYAAQAAAQVSSVTSWIGNTFPGPSKWVQSEVADIYVAKDGTVYTNSVWDEGGREAGVYKAGDASANPGFTHGYGNMGGKAVAANSTYLYLGAGMNNFNGQLVDPTTYPPAGRNWYGVSRRPLSNVSSAAPFTGGKGGAPQTLQNSFLIVNDVPIGVDASIAGLAATDKQLFISNPYTNQIFVYSAISMALVSSFSFSNPGKLCVAPDGSLWIVQTGAAPKVLHYSAAGSALADQITDAADPEALAIDNQGRLMVADAGPSLQIRLYGISGAPALAGTFGTSGGIYSGTPGAVGDLKFGPPSGVGADAAGNVYVASSFGGADIRCLSAASALLWRVIGLEGVDTAVVDPATGGGDVYTTRQHFTMDYTKPPGQESTWKGLSIQKFSYPADPREAPQVTALGPSALAVRTLYGNKYLFLTDQLSSTLQIFRINGEIAVPSGFFAIENIAGWLPGIQPVAGRWTWRDVNGDGDFQANEFFDADGVTQNTVWGWDIDDSGNIWQTDEVYGVRKYAVQGVDGHGNLIYSRSMSTLYGIPAPFTQLSRAKYAATSDTLYLSGYTVDHPEDPNEPTFGLAGTEIIRYDHWSTGNRNPTWRIVLPYNPPDNLSLLYHQPASLTIKDFTVEGQLVVAGLFSIAPGQFLYLYDAATGLSIGQIAPDSAVNSTNGLIDGTQLLQAYQHGGEYLVFAEEVTWSKVLMYRVTVATPLTNHAPAFPSVTPNTGSGSTQTFKFTFSDQDGATDLKDGRMLFNSRMNTAGACAVTFQRGSNSLSLMDDTGLNSAGSVSPGSGTLQNSQCTLNGAATTVATVGNTLTLNLGLTFSPTFLGFKNIYAQGDDNEGLTSGMQTVGTWTGAQVVPPLAVSVTPNSGNLASQIFTFTYSDPNGALDFNWVAAMISPATGGTLCYVYYNRASGTLLLLDDTNAAWLPPLTLGVAGIVQNSQCTLDAGASSVRISGNTLTLKISLSFKPAFSGPKNFYLFAMDNEGLSSGYQNLGTWTVPGPPPVPPTVVSVTPNAGTGLSQTFSFVYSDPAGAGNLNWVAAEFTLSGVSGACFVYYGRAANTLLLLNDAWTDWSQSLTPGVAGKAQNSQCTLDAGKSSVTTAGNNLTLTLALTFQPSFAGPLTISMYDVNYQGLTSNLQARGSWTVPGPAAQPPAPVSVTPSSGSGASQIFTFVYNDAAGSSAINWTASGFVSNAWCYVYYARVSKTLLLLNDAGTGWS